MYIIHTYISLSILYIYIYIYIGDLNIACEHPRLQTQRTVCPVVLMFQNLNLQKTLENHGANKQS